MLSHLLLLAATAFVAGQTCQDSKPVNWCVGQCSTDQGVRFCPKTCNACPPSMTPSPLSESIPPTTQSALGSCSTEGPCKNKNDCCPGYSCNKHGSGQNKEKICEKIQTFSPTATPSMSPSSPPTFSPTSRPTISRVPSKIPSMIPTSSLLSEITSAPSPQPTTQSAPGSCSTEGPCNNNTNCCQDYFCNKHGSGQNQKKICEKIQTSSPAATPATSPSSPPTSSPTSRPTISRVPSKIPSIIPTSSPMSEITSAPSLIPTTYPSVTPSSPPSVTTMNVITNCPPPGSGPEYIEPGQHNMSISSQDQLCTITKIAIAEDGSIKSIVPVARSYDANDWESAPGEFAAKIFAFHTFACDQASGLCSIDLPSSSLSSEEEYALTSYSYSLPPQDEVARFLEQTTFGTTKQDLDSWDHANANAMTEWVAKQMDVAQTPVTSHREYWRKRTSPRWMFPQKVGRSDHPCRVNSRWRKFTFTRKDRSTTHFHQFLQVTPVNRTVGESAYILNVNYHPRTVVDAAALKFRAAEHANYTFNVTHTYDICSFPDEHVGGRLYLSPEDGSCQEIDRGLGNPAIDFTGFESYANYIIQLPSNALQTIDEHLTPGDEEFILTTALNDPMCGTIPYFSDDNDVPILGKLPDGTWLQWDPRLILEKNTAREPLQDGGESIEVDTGGATLCSNAPRTFLNSDECVLAADVTGCGVIPTPQTEITLNAENIRKFYELTGRYVYAMLGLAVKDNFNNIVTHPCTTGWRSRWVKEANLTTCNPTPLGNQTINTLTELILAERDENAKLCDIVFLEGKMCDPLDTDKATYTSNPYYKLQIGADCWSHVHPEHLSVYDMTYWTYDNTHPGNKEAARNGHPHPIKKWAENNSSYIGFPSNHPLDSSLDHSMIRWGTHHVKFEYVGRFGDPVNFRDLPNELRVDEIADHFGIQQHVEGNGVLICGSPGEVQNEPALGSAFDLVSVGSRDTTYTMDSERQREVVWTNIVLGAKDQLRQRIAWALCQILVVVKEAISTQSRNTEIFLQYYDIFVRRAFGNYRDILREISFSPLMAENLSFLRSKSAAYIFELYQGKRSFADENFAREIMQLFTMGLHMLNDDGTLKLDADNKTIQVYTNDDIMSFARAWTGFDMQQKRGNTEDYRSSGNSLDPMKIEAKWRDRFPKTDLYGGYIGDGYPLCVDLPERMFLRKGARYRLLGSFNLPELMEDDYRLRDDPTTKRFVLNETSALRSLLCEFDGAKCQYLNQVVLESNLPCTGLECIVDTVRIVQVAENMFYEYVRPACVQHAFFDDAIKLSRRYRSGSGTMCASSLLPVASEACCEFGDTGYVTAIRNNIYDVERMTFAKAQERCLALGETLQIQYTLCDYDKLDTDATHKIGYHWTSQQCLVQVKVDPEGNAAIVYEMEAPKSKVLHVDNSTWNYFQVYWAGGVYPNMANSCGNGACSAFEGGCLCSTSVVKSMVFNQIPTSIEEVLSSLKIGGIDPSSTDDYTSETINGITVHNKNGVFGLHTIFEVEDSIGRTHFLKNAQSTVSVENTTFSFKNPVHFMSLVPTETDVRDALYETEAVLDHYFYHPNTAPFLCIRLIQRFGISNASPRYVKSCSSAFRKGMFESQGNTFGSGRYGDLAATVASIVLDREARTVVLDADPTYGSLREPLLRVIAFMRNMEFETLPDDPYVEFYSIERRIGQMAHEFETVFSFFLPEYRPAGRVLEGSLVAPEGMANGKIVDLLNGIISMVKYGLGTCYEGFGYFVGSGGCYDNGLYARAAGILGYQPSSNEADVAVDELATLLTSGRLSLENRQIIKSAYNSSSDPASGLRLAQQLIATTPEFHSTNTIRKSGKAREEVPAPPQSENPYKAVVFLMFSGGCDSYNMLVPHTCPQGNSSQVNKTLYDQYLDVRSEVALQKEIDMTGPILSGTPQVCEKFALHGNLPTLADLYNQGDALFFANTGVLTKPVTKQNYKDETHTQLFAHNTMQDETKRVDPFDGMYGTGVLGRMSDALTRKNYTTSRVSMDRTTVTLVGQPGKSPASSVLPSFGVRRFNPSLSQGSPAEIEMLKRISDLNNATGADSGFMADLWSAELTKSLAQNELLYNAITSASLSTSFPSSTNLGRQLETVSKMIQTRAQRGVDRDFYYVEIGGFDTHSDVESRLNDIFDEVNGALEAFVGELKIQNVFNSVTLVQASEFARTLTPNSGAGTDHAWGGNYFMCGGAVRGGKIMGSYPDNLTDEGPLGLGRGRLIPTTSWDAVWNGIAQWMGVEDATDLSDICPNRDNFPSQDLFSRTDLFVD